MITGNKVRRPSPFSPCYPTFDDLNRVVTLSVLPRYQRQEETTPRCFQRKTPHVILIHRPPLACEGESVNQ